MGVATGVLLGGVAVTVFWAVGAYNRLVGLRNQVSSAFGQLDLPLKRRYELIPTVVERVRAYLTHAEAPTLAAVVAARRHALGAEQAAAAQPMSASALGALAGAEQVLDGALRHLLAVVDQHPELKADEAMIGLTEELLSIEKRVGYARQAYNDQVQAYNEAVGHFPALVLARMLGFMPLEMLAVMHSNEERT